MNDQTPDLVGTKGKPHIVWFQMENIKRERAEQRSNYEDEPGTRTPREKKGHAMGIDHPQQ
jgi:hypothetical protein